MKTIVIGKWPENIHMDFEQVKRIESSKKLEKDIVSESDNCIQIKGSSDVPYTATLNECTCTDFQFRKKPCKHMYCLAWKMGLLNEMPVLKPKKERTFDSVSEIYHYQELYEAGEITADAYVKICTALSKIK